MDGALVSGRFHLSGLAGPTNRFLNLETLEFSERVLTRMVLMGQSCSVFPLRSSKAREFESFGGKTHARVLDLSI